jgi:hypothetical protein|tara:strand:- start:11074 stop:11277 length:204 start_codon:yes stop_codon:yes gene_type:complete
MSKKVIYEVFNPHTGQFEESETTQEEVDKAFEAFVGDFDEYQAEKEIINEIIKQHINEPKGSKEEKD